MSAKAGLCGMCQKSLGNDNRPEVTTSCKHTFHRECAIQRVTKRKALDCPKCHTPSALEYALFKDKLTSDDKQYSAQSKEVKNDIKFSRADSDDEWECPSCSADNPTSVRRCQSCGQSKISSVNSAAPPAVDKPSPHPRSRHHHQNDDSEDEDAVQKPKRPLPPVHDSPNSSKPAAKSGSKRFSQVNDDSDDENDGAGGGLRWSKTSDNDWACKYCDSKNRNADTICKSCRKPKQTESKDKDAARKLKRHSQLSDDDDDDDDNRATSHHSAYDQKPLHRAKPSRGKPDSPESSAIHKPAQYRTPVYLLDLPPDVEDDHKLSEQVRHRIEESQYIKLGDVRCYSKLSAGVIYVSDDKIRDHLAYKIEKIPLVKKENTFITFVEKPDFVSYIVLDISKEKTDPILPTADEISRQWVDTYKGERLLSCEQLNSQFPNIYRLTSASLDQLVRILDDPSFKTKRYSGQVYCCADCSFIENVPRSVTNEQIQSGIASMIRQPHIASSSLHIRINRKTNNACIIAGDSAKKCAELTFIYLGDKPLSIRKSLSCRLLIHPVPSTISIDSIKNHPDLVGRILSYKQNGDNLIIEVSDKNSFDQLIQNGSLRLANKTICNIEEYIISNNPEASEIDADTWYETEMEKYKPDIMQFVADPDHVIFRYKWNARVWCEQFEKTISAASSVDFPKDPRRQRGTPIDNLRHQLQVTVMLNTLGAVRNKRYFIKNREFQLNLSDRPKTIVYNHYSKLEKGGKLPIKSPPFPKTTVYVVKEDCVVAYANLLRKGKKPVLLNMASATSPGGGFRKGDGAQEENLFRRSDYFRSLDVDLDDFLQKRSERVRCTQDARVEPLPEPHTMYPMDEFSAIYTSGLTFFRESQDVGYRYMEKPIENVCAIAMAAYRDPILEGQLLASKYAIGTRKKIENVFSIAYQHKHDSLVLSAFGCGAFRNPPTHIAQIFFSVIEQYAGFFDTIVFAIVDDHNAGQRLNPDGNFIPFADILDRKTFTPLTPSNKSDTIFGPYRVSSDGSSINDICIFDSIPCLYGGKCSDISNTNHTCQYSHPPMCTIAATKGRCDLMNDPVHRISFVHLNQCPYGGECWYIDDKKHNQEFDHPSDCPQGGSCKDMEPDHLKEFRHLPLCGYGLNCVLLKKHVREHIATNRHCQPRCQHGSYCVKFHDHNHLSEEGHPFPTPCPYAPFHCPHYITFSEATNLRSVPTSIQQHCLDFAHVCRFGRGCKDKTLLHKEKAIHIIRQLCPYDGKCIKLHQEEHLNSYTHSNIADILRICRYGDKCDELGELSHTTKFRHAKSQRGSGVVRYYGLNNGINFVRNHINSVARVRNYVKNNNWTPLSSDTVPREILDWFRTVQPVHRCNPHIFESILLHGHVMSRDYMENLKRPKFVAHSVMQHTRICSIENLNIPQCAQYAKDYITALVTATYDAANFPPPDPKHGGGPPPPSRPASASHTNLIKSKEKLLLPLLEPDEFAAVKTKALEIAEASIKLFSNPFGIGHPPDKELGTDKRVFSILGPHQGHYYGDVFIIFKREILHHPDADFSMHAATTFTSGNAYKWRPWLGPDPGTPKERIEQYHKSKFHASVPGYDYAIAEELMAITNYELNSPSMNADIQAIFKRWRNTDSHQTIEAHLPQLIPLDYIDHIFIPQNLYDSLTPQAHQSIDAVFKNKITITSHQGAVPQGPPAFGANPKSTERADYQKFVVDQLFRRYERDINSPPARPIQGAVITIPANNFSDPLILPLTISQAYEQYCYENQNPPPDNIAYVYWQALNGDMMLAISSESANSDKDQSKLRYLICYIAPKCQSHDGHYYEQATYLNYGQPVQHHIFTNKNQFKAKSNTFHKGSNTDDYITYCLEIHRSSGNVFLQQAGSNGIYNHEEISCKFSIKELDLTKLEYIHLIADTKDVPVRNLIVCFERQNDLHPTFDKDFKKGNATTATSDDYHSSDSSSLTPCRDNINCLFQYSLSSAGTAHNSKYSHPCRFSELCRNKEPYFTHEPHPSPLCNYDDKCNKLTDPFHRYEYRHTNLPDFLVPCRNQEKCQDKSKDHRIKFSHGEKVLTKKGGDGGGRGGATADDTAYAPRVDHRKPCQWGSRCKEIGDQNHRAKYSHK